MNIFYTKHQSGVNFMIDGKSYAVSSTSSNYQKLLNAIKAKNKEDIILYSRPAEKLKLNFNKESKNLRIKVIGGNIVYQPPGNKPKQFLAGPLVKRVIDSLAKGSSQKAVLPLLSFLDNVMKNKQKDIREELYQFLETGNMPITQDGCFLAYKKVKNDYYDIYSGTMNNSPGLVVSMPQKDVNKDRNELCSTGLHFCSKSYLDEYGTNSLGARIVIVKVNPRHVFAIPTDYNNAKGRASEYYVVGEIDDLSDEQFVSSFIYQDTINEDAPGVKFKVPLKAGLFSQAAGYKLTIDEQVYVRVADSKGTLPAWKRSIVKLESTGQYISAITGKEVPMEHVSVFSQTTKSVRPLLVKAVSRARNR